MNENNKTTRWQVRIANKKLENYIREKAKTDKRSINQTIIMMIENYITLTTPPDQPKIL